MEAEGSAIKVSGTSTPPTASSPATNGSTPGTPETTNVLTQKEILRERYLKGVKKRKCSVCGNTARARCPFRACKTCCNKLKNVCEVHASKPKQASKTPVSDPHDPRWAASVNALPYGSPCVRPQYMSSAAYNAAQAGMTTYRVGYVTPRPSAPGQYMAQNARPYMASQATLEQQELQKLKNMKAAIQAANREAQISNTWRTQKMRDFSDGELLTEDEAFDRYMFNMALLEEVFLPKTLVPTGLSPDGELLVGEGEILAEIDEKYVSDTLMVVDGLRLRRGMNPTRKDASRSRLKSTIERGFKMLKRRQSEVRFVEEEDYKQGRDYKRFKAHSKQGKDCMKRIDLFDTLLQKTSQIHSRADIDSCGDMYRQNFGRGLDLLLPHLSRNVENILGAQIREPSGVTATPPALPSGEKMLNEASILKVSGGTPTAADSGGNGTTEDSQKPKAHALEGEVKVLAEQERTSHTTQAQVRWKGSVGETNSSRSKVEDWPRLHKGFLAGLGWWKVEVDEQSAQVVCQHLLVSKQVVEVL